MAEDRFFINVTNDGMTVHMHRGAGSTCLRGTQRIPAEEKDMQRAGQVEILNDKPYRMRVCKFCRTRYHLFLEAKDGF